MIFHKHLKIKILVSALCLASVYLPAQSCCAIRVLNTGAAGFIVPKGSSETAISWNGRFQFSTTPLLLASKKTHAPAIPLLQGWKADELPFFCKIEHRLGKKMATPVKFRLGSVEYVDRLEGKY